MWMELDKNVMSHLILLIVAIRLLTSSSHRREPNGRNGKQPCVPTEMRGSETLRRVGKAFNNLTLYLKYSLDSTRKQ